MTSGKPARTESEERAHQARKAIRDQKRRIHEEKKMRKKKREQGHEESIIPSFEDFTDFDSGEDSVETTIRDMPFAH